MLDVFSRSLFIAIGAVLGAGLRMEIIHQFRIRRYKTYFATLLINTISTFLLSFFINYYQHNPSLFSSDHFSLFLNVGFLGSFSTFSTFILDLFIINRKKGFLTSFYFCFFSILLAILFGIIGYKFVY